MAPPKLSVCMITYNHESFITQAIEGVLMQKTNFEYELIIGEDNSNDRTGEICGSYQKRHSDIIRLNLNSSNLGMIPNFIKTLKSCNGDYIALCEGDDYWTDPLKLQKQVDFLEANPDYSICFHTVMVQTDGNTATDNITRPTGIITTIEDLSKKNYIQTCSSVFRKSSMHLPHWFNNKLNAGDYPLHLILSEKGKIYHMKESMGIYRRHSGGKFTNAENEILLKGNVYLLKTLIKHFRNKTVKENLHKQLKYTLSNLASVYYNTGSLKKLTRLIVFNFADINRGESVKRLSSAVKRIIEKKRVKNLQLI